MLSVIYKPQLEHFKDKLRIFLTLKFFQKKPPKYFTLRRIDILGKSWNEKRPGYGTEDESPRRNNVEQCFNHLTRGQRLH